MSAPSSPMPMANTTNINPPPSYGWQPSFYPPTSGYDEVLAAMQNQHINQNIYTSTDKVLGDIHATNQYLTAGLNNVGKEVTQSALGLRDAVERGNLTNGNAIERTAGEIKMNNVIADAASRQAAADSFRDVLRAVDNYGAAAQNTTERVGSTIGYAVERNGGNITTAIEKVAGEGRLTTAVTDAASRQAAADSFRDVLRAVDKQGADAQNTSERIGSTLGYAVERTAGQTATAVERNGGNIMTAIEKVAGEGRLTTTVTDAASRQASADHARDIANAVDRNGAQNHSATQSIGSTLLSTIERVAGEGRVTTTVTDAASRQAAADSARDILGAVDRNTQLLSSAVERNGGDTRIAFATASGLTNNLLTDVRHSILNDVNMAKSEVLAAGTQHLNVISKGVSDSAWENRVGLQAATIEQLKSAAATQQQSAQQYASTLMEQQKATGLLSLEGSNQYASLMLEQQKMKEYLSSKGDNHFAMNQLEMHKVKEGLSAQAAHNFSALQLDQHKIKESIQAQLADAKYDALKNTQFLADKMCECCCEVKQKIDLVDRDRLRDGLNVERNEVNLLKVAEFLDRRLEHSRDHGHGHGHGRDHGYGYDRRGDDRRGDDRR